MAKFDMAELVADPDRVLATARAEGSVVETDVGTVVVRHAAVRRLTQDERFRPAFSKVLERFGISSGPFYEWMSASPLDMEGDRHRHWRRLMARTFTPASVERLRPFLQREAERLVAEFSPGEVEFMGAFARKLPSLGLCELIGVPQADRAKFGAWADTIGLGFNPMLLPARISDVDEALTQLLTYAKGLVEARRAEPRDDLVTRIANAADEDSTFDPELVHGSVAGLVFAGHETTKNQLGWMIATLADVPDQWERVSRDPDLSRPIVEEVLRFRSTATSLGRLALEDVDFFGKPIPAGTPVIASLWSANRDPEAFPAADRFDPDANGEGVQLAFGGGAHHCLGAALARAELQESLVALARHMRPPRVVRGTWLPPIGINGPTELVVGYERRLTAGMPS